MLRKSREEILKDFKAQIAQGKILVGVGAGTGMQDPGRRRRRHRHYREVQ